MKYLERFITAVLR